MLPYMGSFLFPAKRLGVGMWDLATLHHLNAEACKRERLRNAEILTQVIAAIEHGADTPATRAVLKWRDAQLTKAHRA